MHKTANGWHCLKLAYNAEGELKMLKRTKSGKSPTLLSEAKVED